MLSILFISTRKLCNLLTSFFELIINHYQLDKEKKIKIMYPNKYCNVLNSFLATLATLHYRFKKISIDKVVSKGRLIDF